MANPDFSRSQLDAMIDLKHPLVVLSTRLAWSAIEAAVAPKLARLPIRSMASLLYLKNSFNLSDEELALRWAENVVWQCFSAMDYRTQQRHTRHKLYALHAPEVECLSKGKARNPCEFGVKVSLAVTHQQGLMARSAQLARQPVRRARPPRPTRADDELAARPGALAQAGHRRPGLPGRGRRQPGRADHPPRQVQVAHRSREAPAQAAPGPRAADRHTKADHRMDWCWLQGAAGDALQALCCAAGDNIRWLLRAIARLGLGGLCWLG